MEKSRGTSWSLIVGLIALILISTLFGASEQGRELSAPKGSTYSVLDHGLSGIYTVLAQEQAARRWTLPLDRLDDAIERVVIWDVGAIDEEQLDFLFDWVADGHIAIIGGELADLGYDAETNTKESAIARPAAAHPITRGVERVSVGPRHFLPDAEGDLVHLRDEAGRPVLLSWPEGDGRIYWSIDPEWLTNGRIAQEQNLELALQLLMPTGGGQVAFDEYDHGFQASGTWWQILRGSLRTFLTLFTLAVALLFWAYGARFGSPRPTPPGPPRAAVEYVYSMSQLYRRAQARTVVLQALYRSFTRDLSRLLGGVRGLSHAAIAERTAHRVQAKPEEIAGLLNRIDPTQNTAPSEAELVRLARETEELQRRMQHARFRDQRDAGKGPS